MNKSFFVKKKKFGLFLSIELISVIVIISVLVAASVMGISHLFKSYKANGVIREIAMYQEAIVKFRQQYSYWPGDLPVSDFPAELQHASMLNTTDGDIGRTNAGVVDTKYNLCKSDSGTCKDFKTGTGIVTGAAKSSIAFKELALAGLIPSGLVKIGTQSFNCGSSICSVGGATCSTAGTSCTYTGAATGSGAWGVTNGACTILGSTQPVSGTYSCGGGYCAVGGTANGGTQVCANNWDGVTTCGGSGTCAGATGKCSADSSYSCTNYGGGCPNTSAQCNVYCTTQCSYSTYTGAYKSNIYTHPWGMSTGLWTCGAVSGPCSGAAQRSFYYNGFYYYDQSNACYDWWYNGGSTWGSLTPSASWTTPCDCRDSYGGVVATATVSEAGTSKWYLVGRGTCEQTSGYCNVSGSAQWTYSPAGDCKTSRGNACSTAGVCKCATGNCKHSNGNLIKTETLYPVPIGGACSATETCTGVYMCGVSGKQVASSGGCSVTGLCVGCPAYLLNNTDKVAGNVYPLSQVLGNAMYVFAVSDNYQSPNDLVNGSVINTNYRYYPDLKDDSTFPEWSSSTPRLMIISSSSKLADSTPSLASDSTGIIDHSGAIAGITGIPANIAEFIDAKMDDGKPYQGKTIGEDEHFLAYSYVLGGKLTIGSLLGAKLPTSGGYGCTTGSDGKMVFTTDGNYPISTNLKGSPDFVGAKYQSNSSEKLDQGCVMQFKIDFSDSN